MDNYGYDVNMKVRWLKGDGNTKKTEIRDYQTMWVEDMPRLDLYRINSKPLDYNQRKEQLQRKKEWQKALHDGEKKSDCHRIPFTWTEMLQKYDFTIDPNDHSAAYVLNFHHKNIDLPVRNRFEKVLNNLDGKMWVDQEFRIIKLKGTINDGVSFGLGIAKVTNLDFEFIQKPYNDLVIPVSFRLNFNVKALLVYSDQREITSTFSNYHLNPAYDSHNASEAGISNFKVVLTAKNQRARNSPVIFFRTGKLSNRSGRILAALATSVPRTV